jgi:hypothetical protein
MKTKISKKDINNRFKNVLRIHADELYNLLYFKNAFAYSIRVEGWACDYYEIGNICFCSGDSPIGQKANRDLEKHFEAKAKKIREGNFFKRETKIKKIDSLLLEFANQLINN